jgi:hypothetical protein
MKYTDLILRDFPIAVYPLDEELSGTSNAPCYSITDTSSSQIMAGEYIYNSSWKAENKSVALVLGGLHSTNLYENSGNESLSIPRLNCFSSTTLYSDNTLEFWLRIDHSTDQEIKIMGIDDQGLEDFGLYAYKNYLFLKIQEDVLIAAQIDSWNDQHHIMVVYSYSGMSLIVDGIKFVSNKNVPLINFTNNGNFLFYGSNSLGNVQIDAIALYKYGLTETNAKRHMLYALAGGFSGSVFTRNQGIFSTFEGVYTEKVNEFLSPGSATYQNYDSRNVIIGNYGMQLDNSDNIDYNNPSQNTQNFIFGNTGYLNINESSKYFEESSLVAIGINIQSTDAAEKTVLFISGSSDTGDLELLIIDSVLYLRSYFYDKQTQEVPYYEEEVSSISTGEYVIAIKNEDFGYRVYINDDSYIVDVPFIELDNESVVTLGARRLNQDTLSYESNFNIGYVYRVSLFRNFEEFNLVINEENNKNSFDIYFNNFTITYDSRIRLHKKGEASLTISLSQFGHSIWNGTIDRSIAASIRIETLYPKITNPEVLITVNQYESEDSVTPEHTMTISNQIQNLTSIDHTVDLTDRWVDIDIDFESNDCLYFPPVLGQIDISSMGNAVSTELLPDYDVSLEFSGETKSIKLVAQDQFPFIKDEITSIINLGEDSGINISADPIRYNYNFNTGSLDNSDNFGIRTISFFAKRNSASITKEFLSWEIVDGTVAPTSAQCYIDGVYYSNISLSGKTKFLWSDVDTSINSWHMLTFVYNSPIVFKSSTNEGPVLYFGDQVSSNLSIQHLGISQKEFTSIEIDELFNLFSGENRLSFVSETSVSISETANGLKLYSNNWRTAS